MEHRIITLTADIVSAHVANNDVAVNQLAGLIREVHQMLATVEQASSRARHGGTRRCGEKIRVCGSHPLPRLRAELQNAQAASLDRPSNDAGTNTESKWRSATVIPDCGARICCGAIEAGLGQRLGTKGSGGAAAEEAWATEKG